MKISAHTHTVNPTDELLLCFDVAKAKLNLFSQYASGGRTVRIEDEFANRTDAIEHVLARCRGIADEAGLSGLRVLAESTGGYEQKLLKTARRLGHQTALISPEHVAQLKKVETNDTGKTDLKDPRVMHLVARLGKAQRHRHLPETYRKLRRLTSYYDDEERCRSAVRQRIHRLILELFPDYDKNTEFTFGATGQALMDAYAFNPFAICRAGYTRFTRAIKHRSKYTHFDTLRHLFERAELSARYQLTGGEIDLLTHRLQMLWSDYERHSQRMAEIQTQIESLGDVLKAEGALPRLDEAVSGVTLFNMARLIGETGPLGDFPSKRALLRYAGLNIRERKSGTYRGHNRISKKGRSLLRKVLGQMTFPLLRRIHLYGDYYHEKVNKGMLRQKAKVAVMRKFLCMVHALAHSGERFDERRFRTCQSQYQRRRAA
jgi:transposase